MPHTPGPWKTIERLTASENSRGLAIRGGNRKLIGEVYPLDSDITLEAKANARLIAAAPELLDALRTARKVLTVACGTEAPYIRVALSSIDAAIAKAESVA
jgi:hypothetical protein